MLIIGLTGSIATGKSAVAVMLRRLNFQVHDSDKVAHQLMGPVVVQSMIYLCLALKCSMWLQVSIASV